MLYKLLVALAAIFSGVQQPLSTAPVTQPKAIIELDDWNGIQSNIIPKQCPAPHFQEQCLAHEITRANAQKALDQLVRNTEQNPCEGQIPYHDCALHSFKPYKFQEIKLMHHHVSTHACQPVDADGKEDIMQRRMGSTSSMLFRAIATEEERDQDTARIFRSNRLNEPCSKKKLQQRARRIRNQERNQNAAAE